MEGQIPQQTSNNMEVDSSVSNPTPKPIEGFIEPSKEQIEQMSSDARINTILQLRQKQLSGAELSDAEVRTAIRMLRYERVIRASSVNKGRAAEQKQVLGISDF